MIYSEKSNPRKNILSCRADLIVLFSYSFLKSDMRGEGRRSACLPIRREMRSNLVYIPATKDKKGREKPAHWQTEITVNCNRDERFDPKPAAAIDTLPRIGKYILSNKARLLNR